MTTEQPREGGPTSSTVGAVADRVGMEAATTRLEMEKADEL